MRVVEQIDGLAKVAAAFTPPGRYYPPVYDHTVANVTAAHMIANAARRLPCLEIDGRARQQACVIVGSSPSVRDYLDDIRALKADGAYVFAINDANNLLLDHGVVPDGMVAFEVGFYPPMLGWRCHPDTTFFVASLCHAETFDSLSGNDVVLWHVWSPLPIVQDAAVGHYTYPGGNSMMVAGGNTTLTRLPQIGFIMGFRRFEIYGCDSSHPAGHGSHFFGTPYYAGKEVEIYLGVDGGAKERFVSRPVYIQQADEMRQILLEKVNPFAMRFHELISLRVHGPGLLPTMHRMMFPEQYGEA